MKQMARVLDAVYQGCGTSTDVAEVTGLSRSSASAYLGVLYRDGIIDRTGTVRIARRGLRSYVYMPKISRQ